MRRARHILVASKEEAEDVRAQLDGRQGSDVSETGEADEPGHRNQASRRRSSLLHRRRKPRRQAGRRGDQPTLAKAAFELETTGELSKPLDLGDGKWSVLELTGIRPESVQTLEQASRGIRRKLWRRGARRRSSTKLLIELRAELKPEIYPERMDAIVLERLDEPIEPPNQ